MNHGQFILIFQVSVNKKSFKTSSFVIITEKKKIVYTEEPLHIVLNNKRPTSQRG